MMLEEIISGSNYAFGLYPGLTAGAYNAISSYANDELKTIYLPKMVEGLWTGSMCLTEPQCGTDLGLVRTKAVPREEGGYLISGTKMFITAGDHDLTENIIHLVLARTPDSPAGIKGISLFIVPKIKVEADSSLGDANGVTCAPSRRRWVFTPHPPVYSISMRLKAIWWETSTREWRRCS